MIQDYLPILIQILVAVGFAGVALGASVLLGRSAKRTKVKDSAYECGIPAEEGPQPRFSIKFYLVAMLFILFDIEVVFMYPWAVVFKEYLAGPQGTTIFWSMLSFITILTIGYVYALKKGVFNWRQ